MRIEHITNRIAHQQLYINFISEVYDNLIKVGILNITKTRIEPRLQALQEEWEKFRINHEAINIALSRLEPKDRESLETNPYLKNGIYMTVFEKYLETIEKINSLSIAQESSLRPAASSTTIESKTSMQIGHAPRLPRIDLPKFNGSLSDWLPFRDLFSSLVIQNSSISSVEKLQYLKTSLVGSAEHLLKNTTLTAVNFQKSWESVISFYENKRLLVNSAMSSLFSLKKMTKESATELEYLYTSIMQIIRTLESLNRPVHEWDDVLVFIASQRLDSETIKSWEYHLGSSKEPPSWTQFREFIMTRMLSLQAFEKSQMNKTFNQNRMSISRSHFSTQNIESSDISKKKSSCPLCSEHHYILYCPEYKSKTPKQRKGIISSKNLCFNCLGFHHQSKCVSTKRCIKCGQHHHTTLHLSESSQADTSRYQSLLSTQNSSEQDSNSSMVNHSHHVFNERSNYVLLATARVKICNDQGQILNARVLLDQGSELTLVTERLAQLLRLSRQMSSTMITGIGGFKACTTKGKVKLMLMPHFESSTTIVLNAHVVPKLTSQIPNRRINSSHCDHLSGLLLADPTFNVPDKIDILIGADMYGQILEGAIVKQSNLQPVAQLTKFGWVVSGPIQDAEFKDESVTFHCTIDHDLHGMLEKFWIQEEICPFRNHPFTQPEEQCENHFKETHSRDSTGRYIVRLPFTTSINHLGDSTSTALRMLSHLSKRFAEDTDYFEQYSAFLKEYERLHHMNQIKDNEVEPQLKFYLPHHGVIRQSSITTKLRVVFNGSCRVNGGLSINQMLHSGPKLQTDLFDVLLWIRQFKYIFSTDIEKMYRQIKIHPDDYKFQRIFWKKDDSIIKYELTTVTYGLSCAPFLALRVLLQLIEDEGDKFPLSKDSLKNGRYVDDIFGGGDSIEDVQQKVKQVQDICMAGGFPLRKWVSNNSQILKDIPSEHQSAPHAKIIDETVVHALGLSWTPSTDIFQFKLKSVTPKIVSKRSVLSRIAQFFDPLGLLSPLFIKAKIFMQELWAIKIQWDDPLPSHQADSWNQLLLSIEGLETIHIPRWIHIKSNSILEFHGFCDASQLAMAAVIYIKSTASSDDVTVTLVCSKTKVAPLKRMTIPRLELSAAVMLTKLMDHCQTVLKLSTIPCYLWTDSSIVHTWINHHPSRWKDFVHNRVCFIQERLPHAQWKHVPGTTNPADCATRGLSVNELKQHLMWWSGPSWLSSESDNWPDQSTHSIEFSTNLEERPKSTHIVTKNNHQLDTWDLLTKYSSIDRLLRITVLCQRFIQLLRKNNTTLASQSITPSELARALEFWIKEIQQSYFRTEINIITANKLLEKSSPIVKLMPIVDGHGLLRVGGRLKHSSLTENKKHPFILPNQSPLTTLLIRSAHIKTLHGSTQETLSYVRNTCWILGGRNPVRSFILKCVTCTRFRRQHAQHLMGQLPERRVNPSRAFLHTGVDYAGPFHIKNWKGKNARSYKSWVSVFVCLSTSAIHLELVTDYSTDAFLAAYKRFTGRRGICSTLSSDCGTNFKGADKELKKMFSSSSQELKQLSNVIACDGTKWIFNPPAAPHFNGKSEAAVKSMKYHLKRVMGSSMLTFEEMSTLLIQIEAVLNSRPLCPLDNDPENLNVLTPSHFLIGHSITLIPEPNLEHLQISRLSRWQKLSQMLQQFWKLWSKDYLQRFQSVYKWNRSSLPLSAGTLVFIIDDRYPPSKWPLGRILELHPGKDNISRVATLKTSCSIITRPIVKLCPLDLS